jgi:hypothetical protein
LFKIALAPTKKAATLMALTRIHARSVAGMTVVEGLES